MRYEIRQHPDNKEKLIIWDNYNNCKSPTRYTICARNPEWIVHEGEWDEYQDDVEKDVAYMNKLDHETKFNSNFMDYLK